jgi:predicted TIM-barrel fold metal-dependent hydrolase
LIRAVDLHVHLPLKEWLEDSMGPYREGASRYFRADVHERTMDELAVDFAQEQVFGILLAWDAETATHRPPLANDFVAGIVKRHPKRFAFFASVDPWKSNAVSELERGVKELGAIGAKFHPSLQDFFPSDERHFPLWEKASELGIPCLFHTGTSGIGAGQPGGQGIRLDYARPINLDPVAAAFPRLQIIAAHFGWPWHLELIAIALHKTNVHIDISGWAPRYIPSEVVREMKGRLQDRFLFGSDYPFIDPARCLQELASLEIPEPALRKLLVENGRQLLGLA